MPLLSPVIYRNGVHLSQGPNRQSKSVLVLLYCTAFSFSQWHDMFTPSRQALYKLYGWFGKGYKATLIPLLLYHCSVPSHVTPFATRSHFLKLISLWWWTYTPKVITPEPEELGLFHIRIISHFWEIQYIFSSRRFLRHCENPTTMVS